MSERIPSDDGRLLAYARSEGGSNWQQIYIIDVATGNAIDEPLTWTRGQIRWAGDGSGIYYSRYSEPSHGESPQSLLRNQTISFHKLGAKQADDKVVYCRPDHPDWTFDVRPT